MGDGSRRERRANWDDREFERGDGTPPASLTEIVSDSLREHTALLASVALAVYVGVRVAVVARFDGTSVHAVLSNVEPTTIALSFVIDVAPAASCAFALLSLRWTRAAHAKRHRVVSPVGALIISLVAAAAVLTQAQFAATATVIVVAIVLWRIDDRHFGGDEDATARHVWCWLLVLVAVAPTFVACVRDGVWLPSERLSMATGGAVTGFVLDEGDDSLVVLRERDRQVVRMKRSEVTSRAFCELSPSDHRSVLDLFVRRDSLRPNYESCGVGG